MAVFITFSVTQFKIKGLSDSIQVLVFHKEDIVKQCRSRSDAYVASDQNLHSFHEISNNFCRNDEK